MAPNGGAVLFYVTGNIPGASEGLAEWLMCQPWCGPLLASGAAGEIAGTLPAQPCGSGRPARGRTHHVLRLELRGQRQRVCRPRLLHQSWTGTGSARIHEPPRNEERDVRPGAVFPAVRRRCDTNRKTRTSRLPSLRLLSLPGGEAMAGRGLTETLKGGPDGVEWRSETHNAERQTKVGRFSQAIQVSRVGNTVYLDHGSSDLQPG